MHGKKEMPDGLTTENRFDVALEEKVEVGIVKGRRDIKPQDLLDP